MEWQPIATAPKNESVLLNCGGKIIVGHWKLNWGAWQAELVHDDHGAIPIMPTHWMKLPVPPETRK